MVTKMEFEFPAGYGWYVADHIRRAITAAQDMAVAQSQRSFLRDTKEPEMVLVLRSVGEASQ